MIRLVYITTFLYLAFMPPGGYRLTVNVNGIQPVKGDLYIALHERPQYFNIPDSAFMKQSVKIDAGSESVVFKDVPAGKYAVAVFHDMNGNKLLDANEIGIPKEGFAFSGKQKGPGKPKFEEVAFELAGNDTLEMKMVYHAGQQKK